MASVSSSIQEAQREEHRKKWTFFAVALIVLVVVAVLFSASFPALNSPQQDTQAPSQTEQISYGDPDRLSYGLPQYSAPGVTFSLQKVMGAMCTSRGTLQCLEPVADSVFVENSRTGISRYEMNVHFLLKGAVDATSIRPSVELDGNPCSFVGSNLTLSADQTSDRIDFLCPSVNSTGSFNGSWKATYMENGAEKMTTGVLRRT
ncbi:MAG: hypothetical protein QT00_C0001G0233 [archaeon GW2011_AR5]|nr:MAG: hypothetical protein QT00_C0001G0233 [archaeon GW2011_AR5]MBS3051500.1 hypothetical protein [Candidatus Aenigmarchaeota archaeon]